MPATPSHSSKPLRLAVCGSCKPKQWLPGELEPLQTVPCTKCGHGVMLPFHIRQFELREVIASGGMGTVYRSFDTTLQRPVGRSSCSSGRCWRTSRCWRVFTGRPGPPPP